MEVEDVEAFRKILNEIKEKFSNFIKKHESLLIEPSHSYSLENFPRKIFN